MNARRRLLALLPIALMTGCGSAAGSSGQLPAGAPLLSGDGAAASTAAAGSGPAGGRITIGTPSGDIAR
jgi:hypothetical protein